MRFLVHLLACAAFSCGAAHAADAVPHPDLASFSDMVRLSAGAPLGAGSAAVRAPLRVTLAQPLAAGPRFSVRAARESERWLLLFSGLALAGWVAHRRLVSPL